MDVFNAEMFSRKTWRSSHKLPLSIVMKNLILKIEMLPYHY